MRIQRVRGEYATCLWRESIVFDLLWRVERLNVEYIETPRLGEEYCGPSWLWVSVLAPVAYWMDIVNFHDPSRLFRSSPSIEADAQKRKPFLLWS
jgi:hypothetical protein